MEIKEVLLEVFTDDPVNWIKWILVYMVLIFGYIAILPLYRKIGYWLSYHRKRELAESKGHVFDAKMIEHYSVDNLKKRTRQATYGYMIQGQELRYRAKFKRPNKPPNALKLYYIDDPKKMFCCEEYHWQESKALSLLLVIFIPWILATLAMTLLAIETTGL